MVFCDVFEKWMLKSGCLIEKFSSCLACQEKILDSRPFFMYDSKGGNNGEDCRTGIFV